MPGCRPFLGVPQGLYMEGMCLGIILGLADAVRLQKPRRFCVPDGVTQGQMVRVVVNYIDRHPETMHLRFSALAFHALKEAWPCNP
jgi:hypothetical protein